MSFSSVKTLYFIVAFILSSWSYLFIIWPWCPHWHGCSEQEWKYLSKHSFSIPSKTLWDICIKLLRFCWHNFCPWNTTSTSIRFHPAPVAGGLPQRLPSGCFSVICFERSQPFVVPGESSLAAARRWICQANHTGLDFLGRGIMARPLEWPLSWLWTKCPKYSPAYSRE